MADSTMYYGKVVNATKQRIEITVERRRVTLIRRRGTPHSWCGECGRQVQMITPDEAALLSGLTPRTIYHRVEIGLMHFTESPDGTLLICRDSVSTTS